MPSEDPLLLIDIHHSGYLGWGVWTGPDMPERWTAETVERLMRHPGYKMGLNLGAQAYENSPRLAMRIRGWLQQFPDRLYVTGGDYAQLTACVRTGESNLRQILVGLETIRETLGVRPTVWTMSEPGNFAQLPQVLAELGYRGALLRIHGPGQGGSPTTTADAGVVAWEGPDGTRLTAVPEYAGDRASVQDDCTNSMWMMTRYRNDNTPRGSYTLDDLWRWKEQMAARGFRPVVLSKDDDHNDQPGNTNYCMRDGHLLVADTEDDPRFRWVTAEELFEELPDPDTLYRADANVFETRKRTFCDYGHAANNDWVADLDADARLRTAEFAATLAAELGHEDAAAEAELEAAWRLHLAAQNHDVCLIRSRDLMYHLQYETMRKADTVRDRALAPVLRDIDTTGGDGAVVVFNPLGRARREYATVTLPAALAEGRVLYDGERAVAWEIVERSAELVTLGFVADVPALGWARYALRPGTARASGAQVNGYTVSTGDYAVVLGAEGGIEALRPTGGPSLVKPGAVLRGDIAGVSCRSGGTVEVDASGPLSVIARERGRLGRFHRYAIDYRMTPGLPYIAVSIAVTADFFDGTPGAPGEAGDPARKLEFTIEAAEALQPLRCLREQPFLIAPFDPAVSPIFAAPGWADYEGPGAALAILNRGAIGQRWDTATGELNVIIGSDDISTCDAELALYPHAGDWRAAAVHERGQGFATPLNAVFEPAHPGALPARFALASVEPANVTVSAAFRKGGRSYLRVWEHAGEAADVRFLRDGRPHAAQRVTLEGDDSDAGSALGPRQIATFRV